MSTRGNEIMYCQTHYRALPSDVHRSDMEKLAERWSQEFPGWKVIVEPRTTPKELAARRARETQTIRPDYRAQRQSKRAPFDPAKPVDWTQYGYKLDKNGRWYYARKRPNDKAYDVMSDND